MNNPQQQAPPANPGGDRSAWRIQIANLKTAGELRDELEGRGFKVETYQDDYNRTEQYERESDSEAIWIGSWIPPAGNTPASSRFYILERGRGERNQKWHARRLATTAQIFVDLRSRTMRSRYLPLMIYALAIVAFAAAPARTQFGGQVDKAKSKIEKAREKADKATTPRLAPTSGNGGASLPASAGSGGTVTRTSGAAGAGVSADLHWDNAFYDKSFTDRFDPELLKQMVRYNVEDYGKGGIIVFSKAPLSARAATLDDSTFVFKAGEPIYATAFLKKPVGKGDADWTHLNLDVSYITVGGDSDDIRSLAPSYRRNMERSTVVAFDILPRGGKPEDATVVKQFASTFDKLPRGVHIVKVLLRSDTNAVGAFYLDNRDGGSYADIQRQLAADVQMPKAGMRDPALEAQLMQYLREWSSRPGSKATPLRVVITSPEWAILRNEVTGVITGRVIATRVAMRRSDGGCYVTYMEFKENYDGRAYGKPYWAGSRDSENQDIACENVNK